MPGNTTASRTMNLNYVNFLACIQLASDWFKTNQLLSEFTHAQYREPVPLTSLQNFMVSTLASTLISRKIKYAKLKQVFTTTATATTTAAASAATTSPTNYYDDDDDDNTYNSEYLLKCHNEI